MEINTRDFGILEVDEGEIINFYNGGLYGFQDVTEYVLLSEDNCDFYYLQSVRSQLPCFIVFDPIFISSDYKPAITDEIINQLKLDKIEDLRYLAISVIPDDISKATINLRCPILINYKKRLAIQVIQEDSKYSIRHPMFISPEEVENNVGY